MRTTHKLNLTDFNMHVPDVGTIEVEALDLKTLYIGEFEELTLRAILRLKDDAYGASIRELLENETGRSVTVGALYTTLNRLEQKGFISYQTGEAIPERDGRPKRYCRIKDVGKQALLFAERNRLALIPNLMAALT